MRRMKILVFATVVSLLALAGAAVQGIAGLNPSSPGLPTNAQYPNDTKNYGNNSFSSMCVDCHGRNPVAATTAAAYGSHFVSYGATLAATAATSTNSSGGWGTAGTNSQQGPLDNGAYVRISAWPFSAVTSKYGRTGDNASISYDNTGNRTGTVVTATADYRTVEIICESCHNIVRNVAGGNNLVHTPIAQNDSANDNVDALGLPNVCVGCHGDMYSGTGPALSNGANDNVGGTHKAKYDSQRNRNETYGLAATDRKGVQSIHTVAGAVANMNHHVTSGDIVNNITVGAGLAWRDTNVISASAYITAVSATSAIGQMPQTTWSSDKVPVSGGGVNCLNCHVQGHGGNRAVAASILRDDDSANGALALSTTPVAVTGVERLGEGTPARAWFDFRDTALCYDCHRRP